MRSLALCTLLAAACGADAGHALESPDPLHMDPSRPAAAPLRLPPPPAPRETALFPVPPPPFTPGIFPCSRCHLGGEPDPDPAPALPHAVHLARDLACADCHMPDDEEADPTVPPAPLCFDCHEADESDGVRAYFAAFRREDGSHALPRRWTTRDTIANHRGHAAAGVDCAACHGETPEGAFLRPRPLVLMERCRSCHAERGVADECATCHTDTTGPFPYIVLNHAEDQRGCLDCHHPDDRDVLRLANGAKVPFGESYRLCGQCHGTQFRDWKRGLHGKRSGSWDGEKRYLLCVHCHRDPHAPAFPRMEPLPPPARPEEVR